VSGSPLATPCWNTVSTEAANATLPSGNIGAVNEAARVTLGAGARIDVSGTTATEVSAARNFVTTELLGSNDLKDSPLQRTGPVYRSRITFDVRKGVPILGDTSSYLNGIQRSVNEKLSRGGSVTLSATGAVVTDATSKVDVSGGRVTYTDAQVRPSTLISADGARFSANDAPADIRYSAVEGGAASQYDRWGRVVQFGPARERFEPGYVEGRDAGTLKISTPIALVGGQIAAGSLIGERQRAGLDAVARNGAIELGTRTADSNPFASTNNQAASILRDFTVTVKPRALPADLFDATAPGALPADGWVAAATLNDSGAGSIKLTSYGKLVVEDGATLELPRLGSLELNAAGAQGVSLGGDITARGGSVLARTVDGLAASGSSQLSGGVTLRAGRRIDVSGDWVNQSLDGVRAGKAVAGGTVRLTSAHGLDLPDSATRVRVVVPEVVGLALRVDHVEVEPVAGLHLLHVPERLGEVVLGVEERDLHIRDRPVDDVDHHAVLERRREHEVGAVAVVGPGHQRRRGSVFEATINVCEFFEVRDDGCSTDRHR